MLAALVAVGTVGTGNLLHDSHKLVSDYAGEPHVPGWRMIDHVRAYLACDMMTAHHEPLGTANGNYKLRVSTARSVFVFVFLFFLILGRMGKNKA